MRTVRIARREKRSSTASLPSQHRTAASASRPEADSSIGRWWRPNEIPTDAFDVRKIFCLIGSDSKDYGIANKIVGPKSDGLVMINNAYVRNAHRAFVHRAHSGRYGVVNSEEAYQNLRRFLFGRLEVRVELGNLELPASKRDVEEIWQAEVRLSVRGLPIVLHEQLAAHYCPIQLSQEQERERDTPDAPIPLTTVFILDRKRFDPDIHDELPKRCRYSLHLRAFRLQEKSGFFFWQDHLEQTADWDDTLIVDVGQADDDPDDTFRAWAAWNSMTPGANADIDPIAKEPLEMQQNVLTLGFPDTAKLILGKNAHIRFSVHERD